MTSATKTVFSGYHEPEAAAAHSSATDFFSPEPVEKAISHRNNCVTGALTISNNGPLHVIIPPEADYFIDPASFGINAEIRVKKQGAAGGFVDLVAADDKIVAPINVFSKCLLQQIDIFIQSKKNQELLLTPTELRHIWKLFVRIVGMQRKVTFLLLTSTRTTLEKQTILTVIVALQKELIFFPNQKK